MGFQHASAPIRVRPDLALSADNQKPDRFALMEVLRQAAPALGLGPSVVTTVDALLSCLPPRRRHDMVFASNATLVMRRNGISDRTLRRHLADLVEAGLLRRISSPNGKRYARQDPEAGALRFGLDLSPLFAAYARLQDMAKARLAEARQLAFLRAKLRAAVHRRIQRLGESAETGAALRILRRQLSVGELQAWLAQMDDVEDLVGPVADEVSASNGQNVRHHQSSEKNLNDNDTEVHLDDIVQACPEATALMPEKLTKPSDVIHHARRLAPMMGIDHRTYQSAETAQGPWKTALSIWVILQMQSRIQRMGAYFRAVTSGRKRGLFSPETLILTLARQNCPRTIG